jgi:serine protease AprX
MRRVVICTIVALLTIAPPYARAQTEKLDAALLLRASLSSGRSPVLVRPLHPEVDYAIQALGGTLARALPSVDARVAEMPNNRLLALAENILVQKIALDRPTVASNERTSATVGATAVRNRLGYNGDGVGVAIIDSGVTAWHDDLSDASSTESQRVVQFVDFVNGRTVAYDDYGHGTHVAGIVGGNGFDSSGRRAGIAPGAHFVVLKVLDSSGGGRISDVIAALEYVVAHKAELNIRVVNLSIAANVSESFNTDLLAQATKRAVQRGIVVVAAAGNAGRSSSGRAQYGAITAPGNAPWVLTVGASSHMGTIDRSDDTMAKFSSRGPTRFDYLAKPDLVAPGVGIESLSAPGSTLSSNYSAYLLPGTVATAYPPYLSLSGTSMATPVVAGTVALMIQASPSLTPNAVKAILQYTAQVYPAYDPLTEGTGFLNAAGAVALARFFSQGGRYPSDPTWSRQILWANHRVEGGRLLPNSNAWSTAVMWGDTSSNAAPVVWGDIQNATTGTRTAWSTTCADPTCRVVLWDIDSPNVVWSSRCGGLDCSDTTWAAEDNQTVVWGTDDYETVVWGTTDDETVVWGTDCGTDCRPVIWK